MPNGATFQKITPFGSEGTDMRPREFITLFAAPGRVAACGARAAGGDETPFSAKSILKAIRWRAAWVSQLC
jgi:hypothetical protein